MFDDVSRNAEETRPRGRRSAVVLLIAAAALLVWALTAGDDPALRVSAVGAVLALIVVGGAIRAAHRTVRQQRAAATAALVAPPSGSSSGMGPAPEPFNALLHQLDAAVRSRSYLRSVLVPRLETLLETKQPTAEAERLRAKLHQVAAVSATRDWVPAQLLRSPQVVAAELTKLLVELAALP